MITVAIITRRLKEGKTYEDFRKSWYHTVGFGAPSKLYTLISVSDPRDITVIGFVETSRDEMVNPAKIDVKERLAHSLDDVIEPEISRQYGILVSEDDFSAAGALDYKPAAIGGKTTDLEEVSLDLAEFAKVIAQASLERDRAKKTEKDSPR